MVAGGDHLVGNKEREAATWNIVCTLCVVTPAVMAETCWIGVCGGGEQGGSGVNVDGKGVRGQWEGSVFWGGGIRMCLICRKAAVAAGVLLIAIRPQLENSPCIGRKHETWTIALEGQGPHVSC